MEKNSGGDDALGPGKQKACGQESGVPSGVPSSPKAACMPAKSGAQARAGLQLPREAYEPSALGEACVLSAAADGSPESHVVGMGATHSI